MSINNQIKKRKYCSLCGGEMVVYSTSVSKYDTKTGEKSYHINMTCNNAIFNGGQVEMVYQNGDFELHDVFIITEDDDGNELNELNETLSGIKLYKEIHKEQIKRKKIIQTCLLFIISLLVLYTLTY